MKIYSSLRSAVNLFAHSIVSYLVSDITTKPCVQSIDPKTRLAWREKQCKTCSSGTNIERFTHAIS
jgi:hypothetical protein